MGIPPAGVCDGGGGTVGGGDLSIPPLEHSRTVYCDKSYYGPISGGGLEAGFKGVQAVVRTGQGGCGGYSDGGSGGGTDGFQYLRSGS